MILYAVVLSQYTRVNTTDRHLMTREEFYNAIATTFDKNSELFVSHRHASADGYQSFRADRASPYNFCFSNFLRSDQ